MNYYYNVDKKHKSTVRIISFLLSIEQGSLLVISKGKDVLTPGSYSDEFN